MHTGTRLHPTPSFTPPTECHSSRQGCGMRTVAYNLKRIGLSFPLHQSRYITPFGRCDIFRHLLLSDDIFYSYTN